MGTNYRGKIPTNGLVLCLDAADPKSYSGSGSTWFDRSGQGNHATLNGTVGYSTDNGGKLTISASTSNYISSPINLQNTRYTVIAGARYSGTTKRRVISSNAGNWLLGWWNGSKDGYYAEGWVKTTSGTDTNWHIYAGTGNQPSDSWALYKNGVLLAGPNANGGNGPNGIRVGNSGVYTGETSDCECSFILAYNRVLSAEEIKEIYELYRKRFDL